MHSVKVGRSHLRSPQTRHVVWVHLLDSGDLERNSRYLESSVCHKTRYRRNEATVSAINYRLAHKASLFVCPLRIRKVWRGWSSAILNLRNSCWREWTTQSFHQKWQSRYCFWTEAAPRCLAKGRIQRTRVRRKIRGKSSTLIFGPWSAQFQ